MRECEICGRDESEAKQIDEHHKIPRRDPWNGPDTEQNLVDLCKRCHKSIERIYDVRFWDEVGIIREETVEEVEVKQKTPRLLAEYTQGSVSVYCGCGTKVIDEIKNAGDLQSLRLPVDRPCCNVGNLQTMKEEYVDLSYICFRTDIDKDPYEILGGEGVPSNISETYGSHPEEVDAPKNIPVAFLSAWGAYLSENDVENEGEVREFMHEAGIEWKWQVGVTSEEGVPENLSETLRSLSERWAYEMSIGEEVYHTENDEQ